MVLWSELDGLVGSQMGRRGEERWWEERLGKSLGKDTELAECREYSGIGTLI